MDLNSIEPLQSTLRIYMNLYVRSFEFKIDNFSVYFIMWGFERNSGVQNLKGQNFKGLCANN